MAANMNDLIPADLRDPKTLGKKQELFSFLLAMLLMKAYARGFRVRMGDVFDSDGDGGHMTGSVHELKLAADLNLFRAGKYLTRSEDHTELGDYWKKLHPLCRWGGDFKDAKGKPRPDGNHYSLTHAGRA